MHPGQRIHVLEHGIPRLTPDPKFLARGVRNESRGPDAIRSMDISIRAPGQGIGSESGPEVSEEKACEIGGSHCSEVRRKIMQKKLMGLPKSSC